MPGQHVGWNAGGSQGFGGEGGGAAGVDRLVSPVILSPFNEIFSIGNHCFANQNAVPTLAAAAFPASGRAMIWPFWLPTAIVYTQAWIQNGGTAAGNIEIAVYNSDLTLHTTTGSFAQVGTSVVQFQAQTFTLAAGQYFLWQSASDGTGTTVRDTISSGVMANQFGMFQQDLAPGSAPGTATPAAVVSNVVHVTGLSVRTF